MLKDGHQRALGTYSELASSALTELTQLEQETELDDAVYDEQICTKAASAASQLVADQSGPESGSALQGLNAAPIQASVNAVVPAAVMAASQTATAADHLTTGQHMDGGLATSVPSDSLATLATSSTAATAVAPAANGLNTAPATSAVQAELLSPVLVADSNPVGLSRQPQGQGHKQQATFCPAVVVKKKIVLPPRVDNRWGPVKAYEKWYHRVRGYGKAHKAEDEGLPEEEDPEKEQAQLNQQEGRATGVQSLHYQNTNIKHKLCFADQLESCSSYILLSCAQEADVYLSNISSINCNRSNK